MNFREIIDRIAEACEWKVSDESEDVLSIDVPTGGGRSQVVVVTEDVDIAEQPLARYWSVIGPAKDIEFRRCLEENANLSYGAFALKEDQLVIMDTQLIQDADPMEVASSIGNLAAYADRYERDLFGVDRF